MALTVETAQHAYDLAHYGDASSEAQLSALHDLMAAEEAAGPAVKIKRLRLKASDARAAYQRHMDAYGPEIGLATRREAQGETTLAKLAESAAQASLICASECLTQALALEAEADEIERGPFVVLFDGVSARRAQSYADGVVNQLRGAA